MRARSNAVETSACGLPGRPASTSIVAHCCTRARAQPHDRLAYRADRRGQPDERRVGVAQQAVGEPNVAQDHALDGVEVAPSGLDVAE